MSHRQTKSRVEGRRGGSRAGGLITAGVLAGVVSVPALAGPSGEQVVHGTARFDRAGNATTITTSHRAIINYDSFNLGQNESVRFVQPGASSRVLNRIQSDMPTTIDGSILANGNVYFVNRAGIYFGQNSVINVGGIYAAAGNITDQNFLNNVNQFTDLSGSVINEGTINATKEAHLVGRRVANMGRIVAPDGMISMTAGDDVLLGQRGGKVFARISGDAANGGAVGVENSGVIDAGSGQVLAGVGDHFALALYDTSVIRGDSVRIAGSARSTVTVRGEVDASSDRGVGGDVEVLGGRIGLYGASIDASGATGGGEIHIGGDERGIGDRTRAEVTLVDSASTLSIDATRSGDAGRAIVWSDGATVFRGKVSGKAPGKGGFTEVSSLGYMEFDGTIDLRGVAGNGTLLLDPKNINITATDVNGPGMTDITDVDSFAVDPGATTNIHDEVLEGWLNGGIVADIVLQANNDIVFAPSATVTQDGAMGTNSLRLFAGRRIVFAPNSSLVMGGGSLFAVANAVNEAGFVAAERDAGLGSIILSNGSNIEITGMGQSANLTVDTGGTPGSIVMAGRLSAPSINLMATDATSQVRFVEDGNGATDQIGLGSDVLVDAGNRVVFLGNAGNWSFGSLDVTGSAIEFDANATGVVATAGSLRFDSPMTTSDAAGLFTFGGPTTIVGGYQSVGAALFDGTLALGGSITANGDLTFADTVTLTDDATINLASAGTIEFQSNTAVTNPLADDLTVNLNGNGDLAFRGEVGGFLQRMGNLTINGLTGTLTFDDFIAANSFTAASGTGTINLGNGDDSVTIQGLNGNGLAVELDAAAINLNADILAIARGVSIAGPVTVLGEHSIRTLNALGDISLDSVVVDASGGDAFLALRAVGGGDVTVADGMGETVMRDAGGMNIADFRIETAGGLVTLGSVVSNGAAGNVFDLFEIRAGAGSVSYLGDRYAARTIDLDAGSHDLSNAVVTVFGDASGVTAETSSIALTGGNVDVAGGTALELNALAMGGTASLFGARTDAMGSTLTLRADGLASLGTGDTVGSGANLFTNLNVIAGDASIGGGLFATNLLLDPTSDILDFGGVGAGMSIDAGEIANLNAGSIGTLSLGSNDRANFAAYAGTTNLFGAMLTGVGQLDVYGNTTVDGAFNTSAMGINFFGPTALADNASVQTSGSQVRFYTSLAAGANTALTDTGNGLISFVNTVPVMGGAEVAAAINAAMGGGSLSIDAGPTGTVTLFDVGAMNQLATLGVDAGTINFRGQRYNAATQTYTANAFNLLGDGPGAPGNAIAFEGVAPGMGVQSVSLLDQGGGMDATVQVANGVAVNALLNGAFLSEAAIRGTGGAESLTVSSGSIQLDRAIGAIATNTRLGSVSLTADTMSLANVFTTGNQTYAMRNNGAAGTITFNGTQYASSGVSTVAINGFAGDSALLNSGGTTAFSVANGGTVSLNLASIVGGGNGLVANAGNAGTITFAPGISIANASQSYFAGSMNFLGSATLTNASPMSTIAFQGGTVNLNGDLSVQTSGMGSGINFANSQIVLNGADLFAAATGANSGVILANIVTAGGEALTLRNNGVTIINGVSGPGLGLLDIQTNGLTIAGATAANNVLVNTFGLSPLDISVGDDASLIPGTLNLSNATLANLNAGPGGAGSLAIGSGAYAGQILIGNATVNRDVAFATNGLIRLAPTGLTGTGGLTSIAMTAPAIELGGSIQSMGGAYALAFNGPVTVSGTADIDTNGGAVAFGNSINGQSAGVGNLDVNTGGGTLTMREDLGAIGATNALASLSLSGAPSLRLVGANTTGDQFFGTAGGVITLLDGSAFNAGAMGDIVFAGTTRALGEASATAGSNGTIAFQGLLDGVGSAAQTVTLTTGTNGAVSLAQVGGVQGLGSLAVDTGTANFAGDLSLLDSLSIAANQTLLTGDRTISAQSISLMTDIDSAGGMSADLTLEDAIATLIDGRLGGNAALGSFASSQNGTTTLSGGVFTDGLALFRNAVVISGDAIVQSFGTTGSAGIQFLSTIDGTAAGADSLTLITDRTGGQLAGVGAGGIGIVDGDVPVINLRGDVGSSVALGTLGLNFGTDVNGSMVDGRGFVPVNATIVLGDAAAFNASGATSDLSINANTLSMGLREKMVALGSLTATGANARLGDIAAVNDLTIEFGSVVVLLREEADVFDATTGLIAQDSGTDFVAGGSINFSTITGFEGTGALPEFSQPGGDPTVGTASPLGLLFKSLDSSVGDLANAGGVIVDVRADGPTNTNVAEALAGAIPQEQASEPVVTDVPLSQVALDALVDLGIIIKQPQENLYLIDLPEDLGGSAESTRVSRRRLEPTLVNSLVADYDEAVKETVAAEAGADAAADSDAEGDRAETVSVIRRDTEIKEILDNAWAEFVDAEGEDGSASEFYTYLRSQPARFEAALTEIDRLQEVVNSARVLGLTEREISAVKTKMFTMMQPNMGARAFRDLIDASPAALLGVR